MSKQINVFQYYTVIIEQGAGTLCTRKSTLNISIISKCYCLHSYHYSKLIINYSNEQILLNLLLEYVSKL